MRQDEWDDEMAAVWASFVAVYRRRRAPVALRARIVAAVEEAARAGSWGELCGRPEARAPERATRSRDRGDDV